MMRIDPPASGFPGAEEDALDLLDAVLALEHTLKVEQGTLVRELTGLVRRRQKLEGLKHDYDARWATAGDRCGASLRRGLP